MTIINRLWLAVCGVPLVCVLTAVGVLYSAWRMSRKDNGWDR